MSALEDKEKDLNKLKAKVDMVLRSNHPASDRIEVWTTDLQQPCSKQFTVLTCIYMCASIGFVLSYNFSFFVVFSRRTKTPCRHSGAGSFRLQNALILI